MTNESNGRTSLSIMHKIRRQQLNPAAVDLLVENTGIIIIHISRT